MEDAINKNIERAGRYMMYCIWIQGQLSDLIILNRNKGIINDFNTEETIPEILRQNRFDFWEKDFTEVKKTFESEFEDFLTDQAKADLDNIYYFRNAISHSHVSIGREFLLYKPKNEKILNNIKSALSIINQNEVGLSSPEIIKINFSRDDLFLHNFNAIKRLDEVFLRELCRRLGIEHDRIR